MSSLTWIVVTALVLAVCGAAAAEATAETVAGTGEPGQQSHGSVSLGLEYSTGRCGSAATTRTLYMPLVGTWYPNERLDVSVEVPLVFQSSPNAAAHSLQANQGIMMAKSVQMGSGQGSGGMFSGATGLGDIIVRTGVITLFEDEQMPQLRPSLFVKLPTASRDNNLGTGALDVGAALEARKWFGPLSTMAEVYYNWQGQADGLDLVNYLGYSAGIGYQVTATLQPQLFIKGTTPTGGNGEGALEARARLIWTVSEATTLDVFVSRGFSTGSPDYGGGVTAVYSF